MRLSFKKTAPEKVTNADTEPKKLKIPGLVKWVGGFFVSFVAICVGMFFLLRSMQPPEITPVIPMTVGQSVPESTIAAAEEIPVVAIPSNNVEIPDIDLTEYGLPAGGMIPADSVKVAIARLLQEKDKTQQELAAIQQNLTSKAQTADSLQHELAVLLQTQGDFDAKRISRLAKIFEAMKADEAAPVMAQLSDDVNVSILLKMKERPAAKILSAMPIPRAATISRLISQKVLEG